MTNLSKMYFLCIPTADAPQQEAKLTDMKLPTREHANTPAGNLHLSFHSKTQFLLGNDKPVYSRSSANMQ